MKFGLLGLIGALLLFTYPGEAHAAAGIFASGGGKKTVGQNFTVTVTASGTEFDSLQGTISVSGPVTVVSFSAGGATWLPGKSPSNGNQFVGITSKTSSLTVARITLRGTKEGSGSVSVSGAKLAKSGSVVATDSGSTSFQIERAPSLPGSVKVSSSSHPDENTAYENRTIELSWEKASGVSGFSYVLDQSDNTTPAATVTTTDTSAKFENKDVGTYYFHIRAKNGDGWGGTTHFKIQIKEPDPKVDDATAKPTLTAVMKAESFTTDIANGTAQGVLIKGTVPVGFKANLSLTPGVTLPEGKSLSVDANELGEFSLLIDFPIRAGFYKVTVQGQQDKTLTPVSDPLWFEISMLEGGSVRQLTEADMATPTPTPEAKVDNNDDALIRGEVLRQPVLWIVVLLAAIAAVGIPAYSHKRHRK